ncbi:unnamed protein product [Strongylus vulgaris]|uniref:Uncharacterized protein n=1 Tax=Strongylus vulgaris TaxID=40348 RepID=A0A3P7J524_STRVU|nr:unnamed protein product [Strongylus vulgaris]
MVVKRTEIEIIDEEDVKELLAGQESDEFPKMTAKCIDDYHLFPCALDVPNSDFDANSVGFVDIQELRDIVEQMVLKRTEIEIIDEEDVKELLAGQESDEFPKVSLKFSIGWLNGKPNKNSIIILVRKQTLLYMIASLAFFMRPPLDQIYNSTIGDGICSGFPKGFFP